MIEKLQLKNFTCFADTTFEFSKGINVLIGENGTGKTHVLKVLASCLCVHNDFLLSAYRSPTEYFYHYFNFENLESLIKSNAEKFGLSFEVNKGLFTLYTDKGRIQSSGSVDFDENPVLKFLAIPTKEILSIIEGFRGLLEKRELNFGEIYYQLAKALELPPLKKEYAKEHGLLDFITELKEVLGGAEAINENGRFYLKEGEQKTEINLVAEGWRKIATLIYLILNGELELNENMVLLIDKPEANLNPKLIKVMADFLRKLANKGVQIFIATHSYLLSHYLSWNTEYKDKMEDPAEVRFFGLTKSENGIDVDMADTILDIEKDPIAESYLDYYRKEEGILMEDEEEYKTE